MKYLLSILIFSLLSTNAQAYFVDGNKLVSNLKEFKNAESKNPDTDYSNSAAYWNYLLGISDALSLNGIICIPDNANIRQISLVVAKYLDNNPERWSEPAYFLVSDALKTAFPCQK